MEAATPTSVIKYQNQRAIKGSKRKLKRKFNKKSFLCLNPILISENWKSKKAGATRNKPATKQTNVVKEKPQK